jgi:DNA polymerase epsilon subunit 1
MPDETGMEKSALDLYFIDREGGNFKTTIFYEPYFYIDVAEGSRSQAEVAQHLLKRFEGCRVDAVVLDDLDLPNHLGGRKHSLLKISFGTVAELMDVRSALRYILVGI